MKHFFWVGLIALFFISCNRREKFPEFVTRKVAPEIVNLSTDLKTDSADNVLGAPSEGSHAVLDSLHTLQQMYFQKNEGFDVERFRLLWESFKNETDIRTLSQQEARWWFNVTGFLFQLTGKASVVEELEKTVWLRRTKLSESWNSFIKPYIFTKSVDHIHVNLFLPAEIGYEHSLGGKVQISQEADFPFSGDIRLKFNVEIKRYIEVYVRIPSWAEDASVTVKGVKYFAPPGDYCKIAKKWKEGDEVEIQFSLKNLPGYLSL